MAQLMPLPLTVSCFSKIQIGFTFLVPGKFVCIVQKIDSLHCEFEALDKVLSGVV